MEKTIMETHGFEDRFSREVDRYLTPDGHTPINKFQKDNSQYRELVNFAAGYLVQAKDPEEFLNRLKKLFFRPVESFPVLPTPVDLQIINAMHTTQEEVTDFIIAVSTRALSLQKESSKVSDIQERTGRTARKQIK